MIVNGEWRQLSVLRGRGRLQRTELKKLYERAGRFFRLLFHQPMAAVFYNYVRAPQKMECAGHTPPEPGGDGFLEYTRRMRPGSYTHPASMT
jgi:hypothetical protein